MRRNKIVLLLLSLLFHFDLLRCGEFKKANFNEPLRTEHEHKTRRNDNFNNYNITVLMGSTKEIEQTAQTTPQYSFLGTQLGNESYTYDSPASLSIPSSPFPNESSVPTSLKIEPQYSSLTPPYSSAPDYKQPTVITTVDTTYIASLTVPTPEGTSLTSSKEKRSSVSVNLSTLGPAPVSYPADTPPIHFNPLVAEFAKKWLQDIVSTTAPTPKLLVPVLTPVFDYDFTTQNLSLAIRRNQKISQRKISYRQLKNRASRYKTRPIGRQRVTVPQISEKKNPKSETKTFWHDPPKLSLQRTKRTQTLTTATKQRLKPGLLLGRATISNVRNTEDVEKYEKKTSGINGRERIMRMHKILAMTKKEWYSDRTVVQTGTATQTIENQILRYRTVSTTTTSSHMDTSPSMDASPLTDTSPSMDTTSTPQSLFTIKTETRQETYMIVFLTELTRLIATKEKTAVHDVVKHADQIIHGFYKSGQLQWFGQPLIDISKKLAKWLKELEIEKTQKHAADIHHMLRQRRQMLSVEVNTILEHADKLYDDEEGNHLLEVLNEFAAYPNITLTSYWLCNSLINNFLRPYRRLTDTRQRQQLIDSVNLALKTRFASKGSNETSALRSGDRKANVPSNETLTPKEPTSEATLIPKARKRKRHHRLQKRKRERSRYRIHRLRPEYSNAHIGGDRERDLENLMLRSMTPRTSLELSQHLIG